MTDLKELHSLNQQLHEAIKTLMDKRPLPLRLLDVYMERLLPLQPESFPEELRTDFYLVIQKVTKPRGIKFEEDPYGNRNPIQQMIELMLPSEMEQITEKIFGFHNKVIFAIAEAMRATK